MSIASRITSIEEHIGNAYKKIDDLGIDLTNVDKNIENIAEMLDTVYEEYPKVQGTGTEVTLNGTKAGKLGLDVKGNSTQETNLFNGTIEQGTITTTGDEASTTRIRTKEYISVNPSTKIPITFSGVDEFYYMLYAQDKTYTSEAYQWKTSGTTVDIPSNTYYIRLIFRKTNSPNITPSAISNLQVGNVPNTSYPQPIYSAGDEYTELEYIESTGTQYINTGVSTSNSIKVQAKVISTFGLTDPNSGNRKYSASLFGGRKSSINSNFSYTSGANNDYVGNGSNSLTISRNPNSDIMDMEYSSNQISINCGNYSYNNNNLSINIANAFNIYICALNQNGSATSFGTYKIYNIKIYNSDILVRDFIPCKRNSDNVLGLYDVINGVFYTNAGTGTFIAGTEKTGFISEKIVNKNKFDVNVIQERTTNGITMTLNGQTINLKGTATGNANFYMKTGKLITLPADTYYIQRTSLLNIGTLKLTSGSTTILATGNTDTTFTLNSETVIDGLTLQVSSSVGTIDKDVVLMICSSSLSTEYTPYTEQTCTIPVQQPMRSIGTVRDEFIKVNGEWKERHNIKSIIFNGSEGWSSTGTQYTGLYSAYVILSDMKRQNVFSGDLLSNYFIEKGFSVQEEGMTKSLQPLDFDFLILRISTDKASTAQELKTWLASNNTEVLYILKDENIVDLPCTAEQISILENLPKSYNEQTNIYSLDVTPAYIEAESLLDIEDAIGGAY